MGTVWAAELTAPLGGCDAGAPVAVKTLHAHLAERPGFVARFEREALIGLSIRHPSVAMTLGHGTDTSGESPLHYIVLELIEGQTLTDLRAALGRVPEALCRHIGHELAGALAAVHAAGAVHRDVKPENVLITADHVVKLMDLGVALSLEGDGEPAAEGGTGFVGSLAYAAPEQLGTDATRTDAARTDARRIDGRADLFALGVLLYELAANRHPFAGQSDVQVVHRILHDEPRALGTVNPQISVFFEEVVRELLTKAADDRFASAAAVNEVFRECERGSWWRDRSGSIRRSTRQPLRRVRVERATRIVGRDAEVGAVVDAYRDARDGRGRTILVRGEAGIGKSRILDEALARIEEQGPEPWVLHGAYAPVGGHEGTSALAQAVREHLGADALEEGLAPLLAGMEPLVGAFAAHLCGTAAPAGGPRLDQAALDACFASLVRALAADRPTIVCVEDLHFAPDEGRNRFAALCAAVADHRVLLVGTLRPSAPHEFVAEIARRPETTLLAVQRLEASDVLQLVTAALESGPLDADLADRIVERSDGNPFFVMEILRTLAELQFLEQDDDGRWTRTRRITQFEIPSSVATLIAARLSDLDDKSRELLEIAACSGYEFDPGLVARAAGRRHLPTLRLLSRLDSKRRLVRGVGERFRFDHHQLQESIYAALDAATRMRHHLALGTLLESDLDAQGASPESLPGGSATELCRHFLAGGEPERARRYLTAACDDLERRLLFVALEELARRALHEPGFVDGTERAELLIRRANALAEFADRTEQVPLFTEAVELARGEGDVELLGRCQRPLAREHLVAGRIDDARALLDDLTARAAQAGDLVVQNAAASTHSQLHRQIGDLDASLQWNERALELARQGGDALGVGVATGNMGIVYAHMGRRELARDCFAAAVEQMVELGAADNACMGRVNLGLALRNLGQPDECLAMLDEAQAYLAERGQRARTAQVQSNIASTLLDLGRFGETVERCDRLLELTRELGDDYTAAFATLHRARALLALGRLADASECAAQAVARSRGVALARETGDARLLVAHCHRLLGDLEAARTEIADVLRGAVEQKDDGLIAAALSGRACLDEDTGDMGGAREAATRACALFGALGPRARRVGAWVEAAGVRARGAEPEEARERLGRVTEAVDRLRDVNVLLLEAAHALRIPDSGRSPGADGAAVRRILDDHGDRLPVGSRLRARYELWRSGREPADLAAARGLFERLREHAPQDRRDAMTRRVRLHADVSSATE